MAEVNYFIWPAGQFNIAPCFACFQKTARDTGEENMMIDEGAYLIFQSAMGAFSCRVPALPTEWDASKRPHVAHLVPLEHNVFRVYLSTPKRIPGTVQYQFLIGDLSLLPAHSIIEVRYDSVEFSYYRKDDGIWTKVAESDNPFTLEVFSHGVTPIVLDVSTT